MKRFFHKIRDIVFADITCVFPLAIKWFYRLKINHHISPVPFRISKNTTFLYSHSPKNEPHPKLQTKTSAILFLHGLYGHPMSLLNLADIAIETMMGPVFSLHVTYDEHQPEPHRDIIKQAIDEIETIIKNRGEIFNGIVLVGHSLGAIESAYTAFVDKDKRILSVISIAGRLKIISSRDQHLRPKLTCTINAVYQEIQKETTMNLFQIVGGKDWNAPIEATVVRSKIDCYHIVHNGMHLNLLYKNETRQKFKEFLIQSIS